MAINGLIREGGEGEFQEYLESEVLLLELTETGGKERGREGGRERRR